MTQLNKGNKLQQGQVRILVDLDKELVKRIDHIAVDWDDYRKQAIEKLLLRAVEIVEKEKESAK